MSFRPSSSYFSSFHPFSRHRVCKCSYACTYIRIVRAGRSGSSLMFSRWGCGPFDLLKTTTQTKKQSASKWSQGEKVKARLKSLKDTRLAALGFSRVRNERVRLLKILMTNVVSLIKPCLVTVRESVTGFAVKIHQTRLFVHIWETVSI